MKKFISLFLFLTLINYQGLIYNLFIPHKTDHFSNVCFASTVDKENKLIEPYCIILDSFLSTYTGDIEDKDYLALDMSTKAFKDFSDKDKEVLLNYLNKYHATIINESFNTLKEKGYLKDMKTINGLLLSIEKIENDDASIAAKGFWFTGSIAKKSLKSTIIYEDNEYKLEKVTTLGFK